MSLREDDPHWYKDAIIYEIHVRAFRDSNADGIGDFKGLTQKLDYLHELGITAIWLLPFYPSPLRDDGYDIADYLDIHPDYGNMRDFREFLKAAHLRGIRVIAELVLNHTSSDHAWFQLSRRSQPGSRNRDMYVWTTDPSMYRDARIIFKDFESSNWSWDALAGAYYWHRFYSHQPDLNFNSSVVHRELLRAIDFWFSEGIDGLRLDAVPYLYEKNGTNCENLEETHAFLKKLRAHVDSRFRDCMLIAEANQWPEDAVAYFGEGDECQMAFHFPLMPRMFMAIQMEDNFPLVDIIRTTPAIPDSCQWATFLRNHDELTLEMVTDEERDYMYRVYARDSRARINLGIRRRLAPLLANDRRKMELMNILLFSLPGTPIIYYGDEIGMGDNFYLGDRNGVRTPMQWSPDRNAGFSEANPHRLYLPVIIDPEYHFETINTRNQESTLASLLWWTRNVIGTRKRYRAFSRGAFELASSDNSKVLAFTRKDQDQTILVAANLSRFSQAVTIDLQKHAGKIPEELFGGNNFPAIKESPYLLTLGPYDYYWMLLRMNREKTGGDVTVEASMVVSGNWEDAFTEQNRRMLEEKILPEYIAKCRWFASKARKIIRMTIVEDARIYGSGSATRMLILRFSYSGGSDELYLLPVSFVLKPSSGGVTEEFPQAVIAQVLIDGEKGFLYDGTYDEQLHSVLLDIIAHRKKISGKEGHFRGFHGKGFKNVLAEQARFTNSRALKVEQSNSAIVYDDRLFLKLYRKLEEGINPELEIVKFIADRTSFGYVPPFAGAIEYRRKSGETLTAAIMQGFVENSGTAWVFTTGVVGRYFEQILAKHPDIAEIPKSYPAMIDSRATPSFSIVPEFTDEIFITMIALLGKRTAELHKALAFPDLPEFVPEPFSQLYQRSLYQSMQGLVRRTFQLLKQETAIPEQFREEGRVIAAMEKKILEFLRKIAVRKIDTMKIRIHGDYHLGQVLYTGKDFVIMDFEGEPARPLGERKLKRSPFRDVAGMIRSFHYAAYAALLVASKFRTEDISYLESWITPWYQFISGIFLDSYLDEAGQASFVPQNQDDIEMLLETFLLEKAVYEIGYELNNRPQWVIVPFRGISQIFGAGSG